LDAAGFWFMSCRLGRRDLAALAQTRRDLLRRLEIRQSTSRTGSCLDGAAAESSFATIKTEIGVDSWPDRATARRDIENWIETYNERRIHSSLGCDTSTAARISWQERISIAAQFQRV
jgi:putative transposase